MTTAGNSLPLDDVFTPAEIADAAGVSLQAARVFVQRAGVTTVGTYVAAPDAVRVVRAIALHAPLAGEGAPPLTTPGDIDESRRGGLVASAAMHVAGVAVLVLAMTLGLNDASADATPAPTVPARLVFLSTPGAGGGGGGGGMKSPLPVRRAARKAEVRRATPSPVPEVRVSPPPAPEPIARPPRAVEPAPPPPQPEPRPAPAPAVQAPVAPLAADPVDARGVDATSTAPSQGSGSGGGAGTGVGPGIGEGQGAGIGDGSDAGIGGGPYRAGADITPPTLRREVKPLYTDAARRSGIEGQVLVEIVVRRDGSVGDVRVLRRLGHGLDERAVEAVRQWRFAPATRRGAPVDVIVEVSLQFKLR